MFPVVLLFLPGTPQVGVSSGVFLQVLLGPPSLPGEGEGEVEGGGHQSQTAEYSEGVPHAELLDDQAAHQAAHRLTNSEI